MGEGMSWIEAPVDWQIGVRFMASSQESKCFTSPITKDESAEASQIL
jgi:hypothetical protein